MSGVKPYTAAPRVNAKSRLVLEVQELRKQMEAQTKQYEARVMGMTRVTTMVKAFCTAAGTTFALFICLSNTITALARTVWSDVGNHWALSWSWLLQYFNEPMLFTVGSLMLHLLVFWVYGGLLTFVDLKGKNGVPFLRRFKVQPTENVPLDRARLTAAVRVALFNQFCVGFPLSCALYPLFVWRGMNMSLPLPQFWPFIFDLFLFVLVEECLFYYSHRLLHSKALYGRVHAQHHEWSAPIGIACIYAHPIEHVLSNLLPIMCGPFLLGSHIATMLAWQMLATITTINTHSGYHFPFMPSPESHDFHHLNLRNNYGVIGLLDYFHGTDNLFRASPQFIQHKTFFSLDFPYQPALPAISADADAEMLDAAAAADAVLIKEKKVNAAVAAITAAEPAPVHSSPDGVNEVIAAPPLSSSKTFNGIDDATPAPAPASELAYTTAATATPMVTAN